KTIVMVTHEPEIAQYAHRIITVRDGRILSDKKTSNGEAVLLNPKEHEEKEKKAGLEIEFKDYLKQALISVMGNKLRSALSVLGILIGVASVIAMLALAEGAKESINKQLSSLGSNLLVVSPAYNRPGGVSREGTTRITIQDSYEAGRLPSVKYASGIVSGNVQAVYGNKNKSTRVEGAAPEYELIRSYQPETGRFFTEQETKQRERVALLGQTVAKELFGSEDPTGATVKINRVNFKVTGVLPTKGSGGWRDQDDIILIPINTAMYRLLGKQYVDQIYVQAKGAEYLESAQNEIMELLNKRHNISASRKDPAFEIRNMAEMQEAIQSTSRTLTWLLGSIAAISLLVGGIGIMNIMLVSVKERTREIGLRKAVGARSSDILYQFMIEAVIMTLTGGFAGIILGSLIALLMAVLAGWAVKVSVFSVLLAVFFSAATGLGFGIWPARQAAELNPIDALRYE
ncbi:MAG TPA: ABC transporter permease, partial [Candidatus Goldiibacteriota bacterium]|nr:ABC transporter permease [Candidatus Goldiibacteriota bacterium]